MKIISILDHHQKEVVTKILKHYDLWKEPLFPPLISLPPQLAETKQEFEESTTLDDNFFDMIA